VNEYESAGLIWNLFRQGKTQVPRGQLVPLKNPTWTGLESNPYLVGERPTTNGLLCFLALVLDGE